VYIVHNVLLFIDAFPVMWMCMSVVCVYDVNLKCINWDSSVSTTAGSGIDS
jgi:hypothetical protein